MCKQEKESQGKDRSGNIKQFLATICLGPITVGASLGWTSPVLPVLENRNSTTSFHLTTEESSWVGAMLAIGALTAAIPAGFLADRFGPKKCLFWFATPVLVFTFIVYFANDFIALCVARLFSGFATGGISAIAPQYISEIADLTRRGILCSIFELLIYSGIFATAVIGAYVHYRTLTVILGCCTLGFGITFLMFPESPTYLMKMKKREKAEKALTFYRSQNYDVSKELNEIQDGFHSRAERKPNIWRLLKSKAAIRGLVACVGLTCFQQMSGFDGIAFYNVQIFQTAGAAVDAYTCSIIISSVELVSATVMVFISEKYNRKTLLYLSSIGTCICLALFGLYFTLKEHNIQFEGSDVIPLTSMVCYNICFALGLGPIPWMINGELFSPEIKGLGNGISTATNWIVLFAISKTMTLMMRDWGTHYTFYTYSMFMALCVVFVKFCVPETRGKTLEQILQELATKK